MADTPHDARTGWQHTGGTRPPFAIEPAAGQESVWDYPRPPRLVPDEREVIVFAGDFEVARSRRSLRVLETASPPTFYLPPQDVRMEWLEPAAGVSHCEWKGQARYWSIVILSKRWDKVAWSYPDPRPDFETLRSYLSFYPGRVACLVDGVRVEPQPGQFYGGWITPEIVGPFKGEPGTEGW